MDRPQPDFTIEDLLAETAAQEEGGAGGRTVTELMERTGRSRNWVLKQLRQLIMRGEARCVGRRMQQSIDGQLRQAPVYQLITQAEREQDGLR